MNLSPEDLKLLLQVVNLGAVVWLALSGRNRVTKEALDTKLASFGDRLTAIERDQRHAPTHDDLKRIHSRLDNVCENVSELAGEFKGKGHTLDLMQEYLLKERRT
ncbi:MAG: hypothetical protein RBS05_05930 [Zoogloea oleivorans]|uniref:hypothetical protein n=1 Tax=Zoogloea oleivorans TaxID=1552750 RepID=UPI002A35C329|nr:hypothetical protein [Zoogloea oleivorans]MDY0035436.1 hypothetical protein [Zoogloea oleivorans]